MEGALRIAIGVWVAVVGAAVGSFLNVVIARVPEGESIVSPGSRCPACRAPIAWYDNVPVVSWLVLRARCRRCRARISPRYVVVELAGAALALVAWARHGLGAGTAVELAFAAFLLALSAIDLDRWELPGELTYPLLQLGLAASALGLSGAPSVKAAALGAPVGFAAFWVVSRASAALAKREALGEGDVYLLPALGAFLGVGALVPVVMLASIQGSVVGLALAALGKGTKGESVGERGTSEADTWVPPKNAVPFGPFLAAGALEWLWLAGPLARLFPALDVFR